MIDVSTLKGKRILITGHTGFKGSWLCKILDKLGSEVYGYALEPPTNPSLYDIANINDYVHSEVGEIIDFDHLSNYYQDIHPDYTIHLAAQPIVRESYKNPRKTYESNVMGTVNILECIRQFGGKSFLNVTTDKVYKNNEDDTYYKETDNIDGFDPYSNSKSCSELVTATYRRSFPNINCPISTARAGNVIGGGDFAKDRIIPDCVRSVLNNETIIIRNPNSIRPYQHVLEPLFGYLSILTIQSTNPSIAGSYNIGPLKSDCHTTRDVVSLFCKMWGNDAKWKHVGDNGPHESSYLKLDTTKVSQPPINFTPKWTLSKSIEKTIEFTKVWSSNGDIDNCMNEQINEYMNGEFNV